MSKKILMLPEEHPYRVIVERNSLRDERDRLREELARLRADSAELARAREPVEMEVVGYLAEMASPRYGWRFVADSQNRTVAEVEQGKRLEPLVLLSDAKRALAQAGQVPEGFALVPVEPTPEMLAAIVCEADKQESYWAYKPEQFYRAMLAAAPKGDSHE